LLAHAFLPGGTGIFRRSDQFRAAFEAAWQRIAVPVTALGTFHVSENLRTVQKDIKTNR
jgi:hypothetical protein